MSEPHDQLLTLMAGEEPQAEALDHVRRCLECLADAPRLGMAIDALEGGTVGRIPHAPPPGGLEQILTRARSGRLGFFTAQVAELFDLSPEAAEALLLRAQGTAGWDEGPEKGVWLMPVNPGPKVPAALTALVKLEPGARFPLHPHLGSERVMVLEGGYRDSGGVEVWRGEVQDMAAGTEHDFVAFDDVGCVCASVAALE